MSELIIFVGFPASGKSSYYKQSLANYKLVSKDLMGSNKVKQQARQLEQLLGAGESVVLDNTNLSVEERAQAIPIAKKHGARIFCLWFTTPFEECLQRNAKRTGKAKVPAVAMYGMRKRFNEPTAIEGFDEIKLIDRDGKMSDHILTKVEKDLAEAIILLNDPKPVRRKKPTPAIFLDKDGVIVDDKDFPYIIPRTTLLPGVEEALIKLAKTNLPVVVVTNQAWVAQGRMTDHDVAKGLAELKQNVAKFGGRIDAAYYCPHQTKDSCECRKPGIGMLKRAAADLNLILEESTMIGDRDTDVTCGKNAKVARTVIVKSGEFKKDSKPDFVFKDLLEATNALYM